MADQHLSTAVKKAKGHRDKPLKHFRDWNTRPKSANALPSPVNPDSAHSPDPTASSWSARLPSSSFPDLLGSIVVQEDGCETTNPTAEPGSQTQVSGRKGTVKENFGVASRFAQTLLKKVPDCVDTNPVKVAISIARAIIEIKNAVGDNKDELVQHLEETANRLLAVERIIGIGVPKASEQEMEKLKKILQEEMSKLEDLARKSLAIRTLDHEEYQKMIRQIFQRVNGATTSFQFVIANSIQETANTIHDDIKKVTLERLRPSEKADHKTVLEEQTVKRETCTPGTRLKILEDITKWANDHSSASPRVFWLTGQAGSGKTTIAYTIANQFEKDGDASSHTVLGGNFFCSRQFQETQSQTRILPTIAYQLARRCKSYANALHVSDKFDAVNHNVSTQLKSLLVGPWQQSEATRHPETPPYLIVVDALDEIVGDGGSTFLRELLNSINEYDLRGLKFLATSRSDPELAKLCQAFPSDAVCRLQDVPIEEAKSDIEMYLNTKLPKLAGSPGLPELGQRAGGLFIYAATAVKYLTRRASITAREQTIMLQDLLSKSYEPASISKATSLIDELYRQIMYHAFSELEGELLTCRLHILHTFLCTAERTSTSIAAALVAEGHEEIARVVAEDLHAVLYIQDDRVFWYHASFPDFIFNPARSNFSIGKEDFAFWCNEPAHHNLLAESCFHVMKSGLRFNMGDIPSSFLFDSDNVIELTEDVSKNISAVLRYSSRHWAHHLPSPQSVDTENLRDCISEFLEICVLFWIEAMNLLKLRNHCTPMLQHARQWVLKCGNRYLDLARDVGEAANFATYFTGSPAAESTPHLYISALATWSQDTTLCREWKRQFSRIPVFTHTKGNIGLPLMTVTAQSGITSVAFSSDGTQIVSGLGNNSVWVWDASTGAELNQLNGHTDSVYSVAFSSDGTRILSGSGDKSVRVWNMSTGVELNKLMGHTSGVTSVSFSSDGTRIVSGSYDESVRVWDALTGVTLNELKGHTSLVNSVAFSSDGTQILSGSSDKSVRVWDASTGVELNRLKGHTSLVNSVAFSSDGTRILSGSSDQSVRVWDASTGAELNKLKGHTSLVYSVAFSNDGTRIVSGSDDESVRVWDALTGMQLNELNGRTNSVTSVAFSSDSTRIVSGSYDESLHVWDALTGVELNELKGHTSLVNSVAFSTDGTRILSGSSDRSVRVWDALTGVQLNILNGHTDLVYSVAFSSDGTRIVSGSGDKSVHVWDVLTGLELHELKGHTSSVNSVALSSDGTRILSGSSDRSVRMWDVLTGLELNTLNGHTDSVYSVAFSSDGTQILSGSGDKSVRMWDLAGVQLKEFNGHTSLVYSVAFSTDSTLIVSGSDDESVRVWDVSTGVELNKLKGHTSLVNSVAFSSDGTRIVSGSYDKSVCVWDVSTGLELNKLSGHTRSVTSVAFSSNGTRIVSGSYDKSVRVWDVSTGLELNKLMGHTYSVNSVAFLGNGTQILSGLGDQFGQIVLGLDEKLIHSVWNLAHTNWIISSLEKYHLMWVPPVAQVSDPPIVLVISRHGFSFVDFHQSMIGVHWDGCYTPFFKV